MARGLNLAIETMTGDWLAIFDDDHTFLETTVLSLLKTLDESGADIAVPLVTRKIPPYTPVIFGEDSFSQFPLKASDPPIVEVTACGTPGMVIRRRVFELVEKPWFRVGQHAADMYQEDVDFCIRARAAGCRIVCDTRIVMGHITHVTIYPRRDADGQVRAVLDLGNNTLLPVVDGDVVDAALIGPAVSVGLTWTH